MIWFVSRLVVDVACLKERLQGRSQPVGGGAHGRDKGRQEASPCERIEPSAPAWGEHRSTEGSRADVLAWAFAQEAEVRWIFDARANKL